MYDADDFFDFDDDVQMTHHYRIRIFFDGKRIEVEERKTTLSDGIYMNDDCVEVLCPISTKITHKFIRDKVKEVVAHINSEIETEQTEIDNMKENVKSLNKHLRVDKIKRLTDEL